MLTWYNANDCINLPSQFIARDAAIILIMKKYFPKNSIFHQNRATCILLEERKLNALKWHISRQVWTSPWPKIFSKTVVHYCFMSDNILQTWSSKHCIRVCLEANNFRGPLTRPRPPALNGSPASPSQVRPSNLLPPQFFIFFFKFKYKFVIDLPLFLIIIMTNITRNQFIVGSIINSFGHLITVNLRFQ